MSPDDPEALPPYTYVPGSCWPHPTRSPDGHLWGVGHRAVAPIEPDRWWESPAYCRGVLLFNRGYYWEAHEVWEAIWHAHGRQGPIASILRALIKLAAAGVKVRERRPAGVRTHAARAALLFEEAHKAAGRFQLGLDLDECAGLARQLAQQPPVDPEPAGASVSRVFDFQLTPAENASSTD
jgi:predicted metal-dependent hydrolase